MGLRDDNPMIDSDLELIITAFEKAMVQSRDIDSVLVPFRRELAAFTSYPQSIVDSIDGVPLPSETDEAVGSSPSSSQGVPAATSTPERASGDPNTPVEDGDDEEDITDAIKDWFAECIPCTGEFKRTLSSMDADFFDDIGIEWDRALDEIWDKLGDFENLLSDVDITSAFCDLGEALKGQCGPDLEKMIFILTSMLSRMEIEISLDLSIIDSLITAALSPIFNALASNLDLIASLALDPIRCVLDYLQYQINNKARLAGEARAAIIDPIKRQSYERRQRINQALRNSRQPLPLNRREPPSEAERTANRAELERQRRDEQRRSGQQMASALQKANQAFNRTRDALDYLDKFQEYLTNGVDYLQEKKDWLLSLIEEFVNDGLDRWNNQLTFAHGKTDLLTMISIIKAIIEAGKAGDLSCGPDSGGLSQQDVQRIVSHWVHPSESLEIIVEDGNIVTRRRPDAPSTEEAGDRGVLTGVDGPDSTPLDSTAEGLPNVVGRQPISSCLKKVTTDEAEQVHHWIRQLEQEV